MKKLLWKPSKLSWHIHVLIAICAISGIILIEKYKVNVRQPYYKAKYKAATLMKEKLDILKRYRDKHFKKSKKTIDPMQSGLIGRLNTSITTATVDIDAKLTTINPNWAAVVVYMLKRAKISKGDTVAVSFTGSFPAINLAVLAALNTIDVKPIIITSVGSSTWGANIPGFTWLDMENVLYHEKDFPYRSVAASLGGVRDQALGISEAGQLAMKKAMQRNNVPLIDEEDIRKNVDIRMDYYRKYAGSEVIAAYINVGGGTIAVGTFIGKRRFRPGLNLKIPTKRALRIDSVMSRFATEGKPVINMNYMKQLARKYALPYNQKIMPVAGKGDLYFRHEYNYYLVVTVLFFLLSLLFIFIRLGFGYRLFSFILKSSSTEPPEHMV